MTLKYSPTYLGELISLKTPAKDLSNESHYDEVRSLYASIRSTAELLSRNLKDKDIEGKLDSLLAKKIKLDNKLEGRVST